MIQKGVKTSAAVEVIENKPIEGLVKGPMGFLVQKCSSCGRTMMLGEGDTLYGERWFHGVCWSIESEDKRR
ncbi:MAG TPA: hypothetical protein VEO75_04065 [Nitrososphaerales archaeon]|jgi:hypothetical protein|nr:hypothetical protein [Nitrososphaerales archaeon]